MKLKNLYIVALTFFSGICLATSALAQEIVITDHAGDAKSIYKANDTVRYSIDLKSSYTTSQTGKITCAIYDFYNKLIVNNVKPITILPKATNKVQFNMPGQSAGFYKIHFMLNVTDDDDTVRRVFGVDTSNVHTDYQKPADFDQFWVNAKKELAAVPPNFKMTERPDLSSGNDQVYLVEMKSFGNLTVRGWLTLPKDRKPGQKFAVTLGLPGYGATITPFHGVTAVAYLGLNVRGLGNSRDVINPLRDEFITYGIQDKNSYIFKGVILDCIRAVDFICSRPELDSKGIYTTGGSMGAYLAMVLASLDDRIGLCSADNPGYPNQKYTDKLWKSTTFPFNTMKDYAKKHSMDYNKMLDIWDYYDLKYFVGNIKCPTVVGMGLLDPFIPPTAEVDMYNQIKAPKKLFIFPLLPHNVGPEMGAYVGRWIYDTFHVYEHWIAFNKPPDPAKPVVHMADPNAEVIDVKEHPFNKDAIFESTGPVTYNLTLKSNFKSTQTGKLGYTVSTPLGKVVAHNSVPVTVPAKGDKFVTFDIPVQNAGFYNVNFTINTRDYDDTVRRTFGVDTEKIHTEKHKPADFDAFWDNAKKELAAVPPNFKVTEKPELEHNNIDRVYLIEMQSIDNITIRGYMSLPRDSKPGQKLPVSLYLPGYGGQAFPMTGTSAMALISMSVRGQPLANDVIKPEREDYITVGITDKNNYILRGAIMDCMRAVDFIASRPELDATAIYAAGASMGGYFSLTLASLDKRVTIASANNPVFADYRSLASISHSFPITEIKEYVKKNSLSMAPILDNLDYYDLNNFADNIKVKTVTGIGMLDNIAPPGNELAMFNNIPGNKKLFVFPNLAHDIGPEVGNYLGKWVYENLQVYQKWMAFNKQQEAAKAKEEASGSESVAITCYPGNQEAAFKSNSVVDYNVDFKNNFFKKQTGMFTYFVYTSDDKFIRKDSVAVNIDARATKRVHIEIPPQKTGFYKINFAINVKDYDDTLKRVFGVDIEDIHSTYPKLPDFDQFWANTKKELAAVPPNFKMTEKPELETTGKEQVYLIEMQSLGNITVRAWLTLPRDRKPTEKFPVYITLPGYGTPMMPYHAGSTFAFLTLNVRGHGNSRDVVHPEREEYITYNLEDKNKYIYRGAIMDGVRLLDFVFAHKELFDTESIFVTGASQGGYLTLCLASLDQRVSICEADNPGYIDVKVPYYNNRWPITFMKDYAEQKSVKFETLVNNFEYFNLKSFVPNIKCKVLIGIGLLDPLVPPTNELIMYNNIKTPKKLFIYPNLPHEVGPDLATYKNKWMMDNLGL
jgi:cephalosporin-C deacetylase-like acetyl esterase